VATGVTAGLIVGKTIGILAATAIVARFTAAKLDEGLAWADVLGLAMLAGIGFTVSPLLGELSFGIGAELDAYVKIAVLTASIGAAPLAAVVLRSRERAYRRIAEALDTDQDGISDVRRSRTG
jgi:Na+:H+ antiporter, NhaA family